MIALAILLLAAADDDKLAKGEILVTTQKQAGSDIPVATARAVVDAPPEKVWAVVSNCSRYTETMPNILASKQLSREGNVVMCRVVADLPFPFEDLTSISRAVHTEVPGVKYERAWKLVEGTYHVNEGFWLVEPYGTGKSLVTYRINAQPKVLLPAWLINSISTGKLPEIMQRVRKLSK